jgi:hypothetical protein
VNWYHGPLPRKINAKNIYQRHLGKFGNKGNFYVIYSKLNIGVVGKDNCNIPAFCHMGAVPKG